MDSRPILLAFNRGLVSRHALSRVDLKRMALSAETQTNWMPRVLGSMSLRNGTRLIRETRNNLPAVHLSFVYSISDTAVLELTDYAMRVAINDVIISRPDVDTLVTNGDFITDLSGWTDSDESGAASTWSATVAMSLLGTGLNYAIRDQQVTVALADRGVEHALEIVVKRGTMALSIGTALGGTTLVSAMKLREGAHSIAFTPTTASVYVRLAANDTTAVLVDSCQIAMPGDMVLTTPWAESDLSDIRADQSGDVTFTADGGSRQQRIERQAPRSWSVVSYFAEDGPFRSENLTTIRMSVAALSGSTTLTASRDFFTASNVGSLFRLASAGQTVLSTLVAEDNYTSYIRVTGVGAGRSFAITLTGTWVGTLTLQRSVTEPGDWTTVTTYTAGTNTTYDDTLANQVIYYRIGFRTGAFTSGSVAASLIYSSGTIEGIGIVTGYTNAKNVSLDVLRDFGSTSLTASWWEGAWSPRRGWPSAVVLHDGRLWWAGKDRIAGSVSDAFDSFDDTVEGDSGPIFRTIGSGPVDTINWLVSLSSMLVGGQGREFVAKASSLDEPLTPTAFTLKTAGTLGSAAIRAVQLDASAVYVHRNGSRVYEISLDGVTYTYTSNDLTSVVPEIGATGFVRIAVQRVPDTRIHCVRADGTAAILVFDRIEKVTCWVLYETDGAIEDVVITPSVNSEDVVQYTVARTVNGATKRYFEKWSLDSEAVGAATTVLTDASIEYTGAPTATITGLGAHEGETVVVWGNGKDLGSYVVTGAQITLSEAVTYACIGKPYTAQFKSARFAEASEIALGQNQQIHHVGLLLADTHAQGIRFGQDFAHMDSLPQMEEGVQVDQDSIWSTYVYDSIPVEGSWTNDTRLCLEASSPRCCTVSAAVVSVIGHGK